MEIKVRKGDLTKEPADLLAVYLFEDQPELSDEMTALDQIMGGELKKTLREDRFKGRLAEVAVLRNSAVNAKRILVVGLGKTQNFGLEAIRQAGAAVLQTGKRVQAKKVITALPITEEIVAKEAARAMVEGVRLADYKFDTYKKVKNGKSPDLFEIITKDGRVVRPAEKGIELGEIYARGTNAAREIVNVPGQHMKPIEMVEKAREIAKGKSEIKIRVYDKEKMEKMGMGAALGIAQGSDHDPYLVHLAYTPKKKTKKKIALVGKAVTFDTGGYSLKPADSMVTMKCDMAGAASVLGLFSVISKLEPAHEVHGIFAAVENMVSGHALLPGDIVKAMNGKTIEILNTDAEGRVTLADALFYATKQKPDMIVDLATLTGACGVCLGAEMAAVMSNTPTLANKLLIAGSQAGDRMWELPLVEKYRKSIESEVADYNNTGAGRLGGVITAGLLLEEFVQKMPWAHIDIGYAAFADKPWHNFMPKGATGYGVRTLLEFLRAL